MILEESKAAAQQARKNYESRLRHQLEREYPNRYVCIEPSSGNHFIGETFDEAVNPALDAFRSADAYAANRAFRPPASGSARSVNGHAGEEGD